jgi:hypothetical protein
MEIYRRKYANNVQQNILSLQKVIQRQEESIRNFSKSDKADILKLEKEKNEERLLILEKEKYDYLKGLLDDVIEKDLKTNLEKIKPKIIEKKVVVKKTKKRDVEYDEQRNNDYMYSRYMRVVDSLPDYMRRNLAEMPSNKGYVWKDCWFFGEKLTNARYPLIMFEKMRNKTLRIHEVTKNEYKVFEKQDDSKKKLVSFFRKNS